LYQAGSRTIRPNRETYIIVIHAHGELIKRLRSCNSKGLTSTVVRNAVHRATALHNELWDLYKEDPLLNSLLKPDAATYNALLNVLAHASGCAGDKRYSYPTTLMNHTYDSNYYTITQPFDPKILGATDNVSFAELSEMIVAQMEHMSETTYIHLKPNMNSYESLIQSWFNSKHPDAPHRAADVLQRLVEQKHSTMVPTARCYNMVIESYAKTGIDSDLQKTYHMLNRFEAAAQLPPTATQFVRGKPTVSSYAPPIQNLVRQVKQVVEKNIIQEGSGSKNIVLAKLKQAEDLLRRAVKFYKLQTGAYDQNDGEAHRLTFCFNIVINAWGSLPSSNNFASKRAEELINILEDLHEAGYGAKPNTITYNSVMKVISRAPEGGGQRCLQLLDKMKRLSAGNTEDSNVIPDIYTYNTCIDALLKSGKMEEVEEADNLLEQLEHRCLNGEIVINKYMYANVMNAYIKCGHPDTVRKVENLLQRMKALYEANRNSTLQPDVVCYTSLINAYANSKVPDSSGKVLSILEEIETLYESGQKHMMTNVRTYTAVMQAISTSREKNIAVKAKSIIDRMNERYREGKLEEMPNIYTYNYMLNACANTSGEYEEKMEAFRIAIDAFKKILHDSSLKPNSFTFAFFLKSCANLLPPSKRREEVAMHTIQRCIRDGHVTDEVLFRFKQICSEEIVKQVNWKVSNGAHAEDVPAKPTRHAKK
jgi:hypothetical protein